MIAITNKKVQTVQPVAWAPFYGFSLLFDHPGDSYDPLGGSADFETIHCRSEEPKLSFYRALWERTQETVQLERKFSFCPLPLHSYHVTVWDGLNDFNVGKLREGDRDAAAAFVRGLPATMLTDRSILYGEDGAPLAIETAPVEFKFDMLEKWNSSVVARIKPANDESAYALQRIEDQRSRLTRVYFERFGIVTSTDDYRPHVSIGYFANKELGALAEAAVEELHDRLKPAMESLTITFGGISLYGMTDMETFIRRTQQ
ncbi:hypothetical protein PAESOLCIP111_02156 [Paenibacillus solanacearum]|uniref:DUF1868 domain-containing protein n=1 Tax=Paenibacillus solanacearum TaxID=2048548 RepID=A0A916K0G0_9BACL|nr:2'-5' RNA ligase family protein [Paenibacillus solanacearum]CAG7618865.1 hypothetical protein PAESOLCIP111_02156 [Paenibacillus solanacearum]